MKKFLKASFYAVSYFLMGLGLSVVFSITLLFCTPFSPIFLFWFYKAERYSFIASLLLTTVLLIPLLALMTVLFAISLVSLVVSPFILAKDGVEDALNKDFNTFLDDFLCRCSNMFDFYSDLFTAEKPVPDNLTVPSQPIGDADSTAIISGDERSLLLSEEEHFAVDTEIQSLVEEPLSLLSLREWNCAMELVQAPECATQNKKLKYYLHVYQTLHARLVGLNVAISARNARALTLTDFNPNVECFKVCGDPDQPQKIPMLLPILFFKQYQKNKQWKAIPGSTYIADAYKMRNVLYMGGRHPYTEEPLHKPKPYKNYPTRFHFHIYKGESQELLETAAKIRKRL